MAERSMLWTTNNVGHGPSSGYASDRWQALLMKALQSDLAASGSVMFGVDNQLAVTGAATPLAVNTGAALVRGFFYENDTSKNLAVTTPVVGTTGGRVILRADYAAQTVTAVVKMSTDGVSTPPALTQTPGATYEIPLYNFTVTTGGVIALTDVRSYTKASIRVYGSQLDPSIVDNSTLEINANILRVKNAGISLAKLNFTPWYNGNDGDGSGLDADIVKGITIATPRRQGGNASNWNTAGTNNYSPNAYRIQTGVINVTLSSSIQGTSTVTLPVAFSQPPIVILTPQSATDKYCTVGPVAANSFTVTLWSAISASGTFPVGWFAIGPS